MSLFDITFIGVGAMIGAGVFALTGFAAGLAGPALIHYEAVIELKQLPVLATPSPRRR